MSNIVKKNDNLLPALMKEVEGKIGPTGIVRGRPQRETIIKSIMER